MHGGLFSRDDITLDDIRDVDRNKQPPEDGKLHVPMCSQDVGGWRRFTTVHRGILCRRLLFFFTLTLTLSSSELLSNADEVHMLQVVWKRKILSDITSY